MLMDLIRARRSVRDYKIKEVPHGLITEVIEAARFAPSGCNAQPWQYFIVYKRKDFLRLKDNNVFPQGFVYESPCMIICCGDPSSYEHPESYERQITDRTLPQDIDLKMNKFFSSRLKERTIRDVAVASTYLVLRAEERGLGTCYVGWFNEAALKHTLGIRDDFVVPFVITVGYGAEKPQQTPRKRLDEILHFVE